MSIQIADVIYHCVYSLVIHNKSPSINATPSKTKRIAPHYEFGNFVPLTNFIEQN